MKITERQSGLLKAIIQEYIDSAQPVGSQVLQEKYDFDICPATIRIEMQKLADKGFISQPHTSAGRMPTDKGYRFFVDNFLQDDFERPGESDWLKEETGDIFKLFQILTKKAAFESHALVLAYLKDEDFFWKEGWEQVLKEPEFKERDYIMDFAKLLENIEKNVGGFDSDEGIKIYIGKENPFSKAREFSVIFSKYLLPDKKEGIVSILGPKRMPYDRNIGIINSLIKLLTEL